MTSDLNDLFKLFPDLPGLPQRSVHQRVEEVRKHAEEVRLRMTRATAERRGLAKRVQENWRRRTGR